MDNTQARITAVRKARYGHRDWIVWADREGKAHAEAASAATVKQALLAVGTQGIFTSYSASRGGAYMQSWRTATMWLKNLKYEERQRA